MSFILVSWLEVQSCMNTAITVFVYYNFTDIYKQRKSLPNRKNKKNIIVMHINMFLELTHLSH